jgi:hypothetical protein
MIKACEYKTCCNFFSLGRKKKFCSTRCNLNSGRQAWQLRNAEKYKEIERVRKKRKYDADDAYRDKCIERASKSYHALTVEQRRQRSQDQRDRDLDAHRDYMRSYMAERAGNDIDFKLRGVLRARVRAAITRTGGDKSHKTMGLIGCSIERLRQHLEAKFTDGMTWDNHGEWHIDHIKPCAAFDLTCERQQRECFNYTNLQPLWAVDNLTKGAKCNET